MTTAQYLAALKRLGLTPHGIKTREALGLSARQLARLASGAPVTKTLELLLLSELGKRGITLDALHLSAAQSLADILAGHRD